MRNKIPLSTTSFNSYRIQRHFSELFQIINIFAYSLKFAQIKFYSVTIKLIFSIIY